MKTPQHPFFESIVQALLGATLGGLIGVALLLFGLIRAGIATLSGGHVSVDEFWPAAAYYLAGFIAGGAVMGGFWPVQPTRGRQYLAGVLGGLVVVAFVTRIVDGPVTTWRLSSYVITVLLGSAYGVAFIRGFR